MMMVSQDDSKKQEKDEKLTLPAQDPDAVSRRDFMRTKLMYSQNVLEGLTTGDFKMIDSAIKEIEMVTTAEQWIAIDNEKYRELTQDFKNSTRQLKEAAMSRNLDATAMRFYNLSTTCIDCHKHVRKAGYQF